MLKNYDLYPNEIKACYKNDLINYLAQPDSKESILARISSQVDTFNTNYYIKKIILEVLEEIIDCELKIGIKPFLLEKNLEELYIYFKKVRFFLNFSSVSGEYFFDAKKLHLPKLDFRNISQDMFRTIIKHEFNHVASSFPHQEKRTSGLMINNSFDSDINLCLLTEGKTQDLSSKPKYYLYYHFQFYSRILEIITNHDFSKEYYTCNGNMSYKKYLSKYLTLEELLSFEDNIAHYGTDYLSAIDFISAMILNLINGDQSYDGEKIYKKNKLCEEYLFETPLLETKDNFVRLLKL